MARKAAKKQKKTSKTRHSDRIITYLPEDLQVAVDSVGAAEGTTSRAQTIRGLIRLGLERRQFLRTAIGECRDLNEAERATFMEALLAGCFETSSAEDA